MEKVAFTGWLAPNGDFFFCNCFGHTKLAEVLLNKVCPNPDEELLEANWIKITRCFGEHILFHKTRLKFSYEQFTWLQPRMDDHETEWEELTLLDFDLNQR